MLRQHTNDTFSYPEFNFFTRSTGFRMSRQDKWRLILAVNLFCPIFLLFFQPFGVNNYDPAQRINWVFLLSICSFGIVNTLAMAVSEFFLRPLLGRGELTIGQLSGWIVWTFLLLGSTTYLYYNFLGGFHDWSLNSYLGFIRDVSVLGAFPMGGYYFFRYHQSVHQQVIYLKENQPNGQREDLLIWLESEVGNERLGVKLAQLLYLEAQDNYVAVYHLEEERVRKTLLRTTLKKLETHLSALPLIRCHRSYIVNLQQVEKARGNSRRLQLQLAGGRTLVPVSRSFSESVIRVLRS